MRKKLLLLSSILLSTLASGCYSPKDGVPVGYLFTSTTEGVQAFNGVKPKKVGRACRFNLFVIVISVGDSSIESAKNDGEITDIATIDRSYFSLPFHAYSQSCTIVRGS